ncbi:hypothetical protein HYV74_04965 [Candidatus Uhrbacteria bacterium]|nr:hypothetical protein [Candidatus Uhrbacteria bacterium]
MDIATRYLELTAELRALREQLATAPIEEWIQLLPSEHRPEIIPVSRPGERIVLARSPAIPECAFLLWAEHDTTTRWQLELAIPEMKRIRRFAVVCLCCQFELYGVPNLPEHQEERERLATSLRGDFAGNLSTVCARQSISTIFARHAEGWRPPRWPTITGVRMVEADQYQNVLRDARGREAMQQATAWIAGI